MLLMAALLAIINPVNSEAIENSSAPVAEQRKLLPWEGEHAFFVDFAYRNIPTTGEIRALVGPGVGFNRAYPWNWLMNVRGSSFIEVQPTLTAEEAGKKWNLGLSHLSSLPGNSPVSIEVNGTMIEPHFLPFVDAWREDYFPVELREGQNSILIRLLDDADTNYWIQKLWLDPVSE